MLLRKASVVCMLTPVLVLLFASLVTIVFALPNAPIAEHLLEREDLLDDRRANNGRVIDADTECIGLSVGLYQTEIKTTAPFERAMHAESLYGCDQFINWLKTGQTNAHRDYFRYWHGYTLVTRPALSVIPYNDLRGHLFNVSVLLFGVLIWRLGRDFGASAALAIAAPFVVLNVVGFWVVATKAVTWFLLIGGALAVSRRDTGNPPLVLFFILGALTAFFDFFTTPALIFALPVFIHFLYMQRDQPFETPWRRLLALGAFWGVGYVGLWVAKILIASAVLDFPVWRDVTEAALFRLRGASENVDSFFPGAAIYENFAALKTFWGLIAIGAFVIMPLATRVQRARWVSIWREGRVFLAIALIPLFWLELASNHSQIHAAFTQLNLVLLFMLSMVVLVGRTSLLTGVEAKKRER